MFKLDVVQRARGGRIGLGDLSHGEVALTKTWSGCHRLSRLIASTIRAILPSDLARVAIDSITLI